MSYSTSFTLISVEPKVGEEPVVLFRKQVSPDYRNILAFIDELKKIFPNEKLLISCGYHPVYVPSKDDESVRDFIRMREDHVKSWKQNKQQINAFCLRYGHLDGS